MRQASQHNIPEQHLPTIYLNFYEVIHFPIDIIHIVFDWRDLRSRSGHPNPERVATFLVQFDSFSTLKARTHGV